MTTGTPRNEEEVTSFSPGVARKHYSSPVGFLGMYLLPWEGQGIQVNNAISVFLGCVCLRGLLRPHNLNGKQGFIGYIKDCVRRKDDYIPSFADYKMKWYGFNYNMSEGFLTIRSYILWHLVLSHKKCTESI